MKNILCKLLCVLLTVAMLCGYFVDSVAAFMHDTKNMSASTGTGSVGVYIDDLQFDQNIVESYAEHQNSGTIKAGTSKGFAFSVVNTGKSVIQYWLALELAFQGDYAEAGSLFVYPYDVPDEMILNEISSGNYANALIDSTADDGTEIEFNESRLLGISQVVDVGVLDTVYNDAGLSNTQKSYGFKLFFNYHSGMPNEIVGNTVHINILVVADIDQRSTGWQTRTQAYFATITETSGTAPTISEISLPKNYFISQSYDIDLAAFATAYDQKDGDITDKIVISSSPSFEAGKAGTYYVTYQVKNSYGIEAVPHNVVIVVWDFIKIVSGNSHTLALTSNGKVYAWGQNINGQLGDGSRTDRSVPTLVSGLEYIVDIAACRSSSYALASGGQLYSWGHNGYGHLGDGTLTERRRAVQVNQPLGVLFSKVWSRFDVAAAVTDSGEVYTWGYGGFGARGTGTDVEYTVTPEKINITGVAILSFGDYNGAAVTNSGDLYVWGINWYGQIGNNTYDAQKIYAPTRLEMFYSRGTKIVQASVGSTHVIAVTDNGQLYTWGEGSYGKLGNGKTSGALQPQQIAMGAEIVFADAGHSHSGVVDVDGSVYMFGDNEYGKLGGGQADMLLTPTLLNGIGQAKALSLGADTTLVLTTQSVVYGVGSGAYGSLGNGQTQNSLIPVSWAFVPPMPFRK